MEATILQATSREQNPKKVRQAGFVPGVLNGSGTMTAAVQFEAAALNKIVTKHGTNAKIWIDFAGEKKFGFIKELQKHPVEGKIIHAEVQLVTKDQEIKMQLPLTYHGREELEHRLLQLQVYRTEIDVIGKPELMPDVVVIDVAGKEGGDLVTAADIHLPEGLKMLDAENEHYAIVKSSKETAADEAPTA